jgi:uncharacterized protein (TIGR03790 family)
MDRSDKSLRRSHNTGASQGRRWAGSLAAGAFASVCALSATPAQGIETDQVLLVVNDRTPISSQIGEYYRAARSISPNLIVHLKTAAEEEIARDTYEHEIEQPLAAHLLQQRLVDRILVLVLTKGVPLKIRGSEGLAGTQASVDSELTLLYRRLVRGAAAVPTAGVIPNPYFKVGDPGPFLRSEQDIYLVSRLDGYTWEDVRGLIDRAGVPGNPGRVVLDLKDALPGTGSSPGDAWLRTAADQLRGSGLEVRLRRPPDPRGPEDDVIGYAGWGSNDPAITRRAPGFRWLPGALASWYVSTSARTLVAPPRDWTLGRWDEPSSYYAGSPQSLIGDLIAEGVTGTVGYTYEPYLESTARPDVLFAAYRAGLSAVESFYRALPFLSWQSVVVGDPLVAPFGPPSGSEQAATPGMLVFWQRRAASLERVRAHAPSAAVTHALAVAHAERAAELGRAHRLDEALAAAREAVTLGPEEPATHYVLGLVYGARQELVAAEAAFRTVIRLDPTSRYAADAERWLRQHP